MLRQIVRLWSLSACNLFGWNRFRHTKDPKKKRTSLALGAVIGLIGLLVEGYLITTYVLYCRMGQGEILPMYGYLLTGLFLFFFTVMKAGAVLFEKKGFEMLLSLPVTRSAILASRFLYMYTTNFLLSFLVLFPGMLILGIREGMGAGFYFGYLVGMVFAPVFPMVAATILSVLIKWIAARMRYKSLAEAFFTLLLLAGVFLLMGGMLKLDVGAPAGSPGSEEWMREIEGLLQNLMVLIEEKVAGFYPPAIWFSHAVLRADVGKMILLAAAGSLLFAIFLWVTNLCFDGIYAALSVTLARQDYQKVTGEQESVLKALLKRELRQYFSCGIYLTNTIVGPIMMAGTAIGICIFGAEKLQEMIPIEHAVVRGLPFALALCGNIMPTTACSVSLEGRQRWITLSLPIPKKLQYDSKILMFLVISAPFYLLSVAILGIGTRVSGLELLSLLLIPAAYLVFGGVVGLAVNVKFPVFDWESEVQVVKQSFSAICTMLVILVSVLVPGGLYVLLGGSCGRILLPAILLFLIGSSVAVYRRMIRE